MPFRSNTPGTAYTIYRKNGTFDQLRVFKKDRTPEFDIDYGFHRGLLSLHVHNFYNGKRAEGDDVKILKKGDILYERYKKLFKGVEI